MYTLVGENDLIQIEGCVLSEAFCRFLLDLNPDKFRALRKRLSMIRYFRITGQYDGKVYNRRRIRIEGTEAQIANVLRELDSQGFRIAADTATSTIRERESMLAVQRNA